MLGLVGAGLFVLFYRDKQQLDKLSKDLVNVEALEINRFEASILVTS